MMNFPKLQMLSEARKKKPVEDEIDFGMEDGEGSVGDDDDAPEGMKAKGEVTVDKAAVMKFLKDCDAKCRAEVCKKLTKMVAADSAE